MKINTYSFFLLFSFLCQGAIAMTASKITFFGTIQYPLSIINPPALSPLFYRGQEISINPTISDTTPKRSTYEITENKNIAQIYIIITEGLTLPKNNEFMAFETAEQFPYRLFKLTMAHKELICDNSITKTSIEPQKTWVIEELPHDQAVITLPENTIIFFMDPTFVTLQEVCWACNDTVCKLPTIIFDDKLDQKTLESLTKKVLLSSCLDFRLLHKKVKPIQKMAHNRIISVPGPQNRFIG